MTGDAIEPFVSSQRQALLSRFFLVLELGEFCIGQSIVYLKHLNQLPNIGFTVLRHSRLHVGANRSLIDQNVAHPIWFQFGADAGQRWWDSALISKVQIGRFEVVIAIRSNPT